jgi:nitrate/TMAO reductase-like tetraheme cytochrome c subunit
MIYNYPKITRQVLRCFLIGFLILMSCSKHGSDHHENLVEKLRQDTEPDSTAMLIPSPTSGLKIIPVTGIYPEAFVIHRMDSLTNYPCLNCHNKSLSQLKSTTANKKKAHWDILRQHASESVMTCTTCHLEKNLNALGSLTNKEIDFNHSYELCAQCHSRQYKDWQGGAHGKRVGGWAGPRVVLMCIECHDPHQPRWTKRWPAQPSLMMPKLSSR